MRFSFRTRYLSPSIQKTIIYFRFSNKSAACALRHVHMPSICRRMVSTQSSHNTKYRTQLPCRRLHERTALACLLDLSSVDRSTQTDRNRGHACSCRVEFGWLWISEAMGELALVRIFRSWFVRFDTLITKNHRICHATPAPSAMVVLVAAASAHITERCPYR